MTSKRTVSAVNEVIYDFLKRHHLRKENSPWALSESPLGEIGVFATRDIATGEEVFQDNPVIHGPRVKATNPSLCVICYKDEKAKLCRNKCGLAICSEICYQLHKFECEFIKNSRGSVDEIDIELYRNSTPLRGLFLNSADKTVIRQLKYHKGSNHGIEVDRLKAIGVKFEKEVEDYIRLVCCVMDANAFAVSIERDGEECDFRGLYPLAGLVNHSCVPNITHAFDQDKKMTVKACLPIKKGEELFHSYVRLIWSTPSRQFNLVKTKHFTCKCLRCLDPTEFGTYMSGILCKKCRGNVIPQNPLTTKSNWVCEDCGNETDKQHVAHLLSTLGSVLRSFDDDDLDIMLKFLDLKLAKLVHVNHEIAVNVKYKIVRTIGHHEKYRLKDIDSQLIDLKLKLCEDLLKLLKNLRVGENKLKDILSIEMLTCLKEKYRRRSPEPNFLDKGSTEKEIYFKKACSISRNDANASEDVRI